MGTEKNERVKLSEPLVRVPEHISEHSVITEIMRNLNNIAIMLLDYEGRYCCASDSVSQGFKLSSAEELFGKRMADFAPKEWAQERTAIARNAIETDVRVTMLDIYAGYRLRTVFYPIQSEDRDPKKGCALLTVENISPRAYEYMCSPRYHMGIIHAEYIDLGSLLSVLSTRELEVLALIGKGCRAKEIASKLFRSVSTIENHRDKIGMKLNMKDRSELVTLARVAVLQEEDAHRKHVQISW